MNKSIEKFVRVPVLAMAACALLIPAAAGAAKPVEVDCSSPKAKIKTIKDGLAQLPTIGPSTLLVSGICHESVSIENRQYLTVQGNPTATIDGGTDIESVMISTSNSREIMLTNLTVTGGGQGVFCGGGDLCRMSNVTVENSLGVGVGVGVFAVFTILHSTIQNNAGPGVWLSGGSSVSLIASNVQGNGDNGITVRAGAMLRASSDGADPNIPTVIQNNAANGIDASLLHGTVVLVDSTVSRNGWDGVILGGGSVAEFERPTITGNAGHGVRIGSLSLAAFNSGPVLVNNNANPDVVCDPQYPVTRGIHRVLGQGGTTNCPPEPAPNP
jgi:hypothetical protein